MPCRERCRGDQRRSCVVGCLRGRQSKAGRMRRELWVAEEIRAEMVANVWKVVAAEGEQVEDGDTIVILESMKMEIPVVAESSGRVTQLKVSEGDIVQEGD